MNVLAFFATGQGVLALGFLAALIVLAWDWRVALISLVLIQLGVAVLLVQVEGVATQTMAVQTVIIALSAAMVGTSGVQVNLRRSGRQAGGWLFRLMVLILLAAATWSLDFSVVLPEFAPAIGRIFAWIALTALVMLSLGDNPVFTSTALLIWCVLGQALAAVYAPVPEVTVGIGLMELVLGLTASYLLLAERLQPMQQATRLAALSAANAGAARIVPPAEPRHRTEHGLPGFRRPAAAPKDANGSRRTPARPATTVAPPATTPPASTLPASIPPASTLPATGTQPVPSAHPAPDTGAAGANPPLQGSEDRERT